MATTRQLLYCEVKDFQEVIPDLPCDTVLIQSETDRAEFPSLGLGEGLLLDCREGMWVRTSKRKFYRDVVYVHFYNETIMREHYIIYHICEPGK